MEGGRRVNVHLIFAQNKTIGPYRSLGPGSHGTSHCIFLNISSQDCCNLKTTKSRTW